MYRLLITKFILPKSRQTDEARSEFILNILLVGSILLALVAFIRNSISYLTTSSTLMTTNAISPYITFAFLLFFCMLLFLSRKGKIKVSASILILFLTLSSFYTSWRWGIDIPQALLLYALVIIMSGILIGTRVAFLMTLLICVYLFSLALLHDYHLYHPSSYWRQLEVDVIDTSVIVTNLIIIALVSWLFNREMERALWRARYSEAVLKRQKDQLEEIVAERTQELKRAQVEKLMQLYRFAELGRISSGLVHELVTPLNIISLNLQQVRKDRTHNQIQANFDKSLERALLGAERLETYIKAAKKQIQSQDVSQEFSISEELKSVVKMLEYRAKKEKIKILLSVKQKITLFGNPLKLNQVVTNLVINGIDAYDNLTNKKDKKVEILVKTMKNKVVITVRDWGCGIDEENLPRIFDPLFTTKSVEKGTGIGLSLSKEIIEKYFKGSITVKSKKGVGTVFTVSFLLPKVPVYILKTEEKNS